MLADFEKYANVASVSVEWLQKRKKKTFPRSLLAAPVEVNGKIWGVLIVDSISKQDIKSRGINGKEFRALSDTLSKNLEHV